MDLLLIELQDRFSHHSLDVYRGVHALNQSSLTDVSFLDLTSLSKFAKHYGVDACGMDHEIAILRGILFKRDVNDTEVSFDPSVHRPRSLWCLHQVLLQYREPFPVLYELSLVTLTLPITTATAERSLVAYVVSKTGSETQWVRRGYQGMAYLR